MKKNLFTLFILLSFSSYLSAQIQSFTLSDYKMPDVKLHLLDLNLSLNQRNSSTTQLNSSAGSRSNSFYSGDLLANYQGFRNSPGWQKELSINSLFFYSNSDQTTESNNTTISATNFRTNFRIETIQRRYFKPNLFFEFNSDLIVDYTKSKNKNNFNGTNTELENSFKNMFGFIPVKIGIGRVEYIGDSRHALFILEALKKKNILKRDLSSEEIIEFSAMISGLKNKRFFDSRLRKIAELKAIDSFLNANNYLNKTEIEYFTTLNDLWIFGDRDRKSGSRISFAVYPGISYLRNKGNGFFVNNKTEVYNIHGGLEYVNEKPINQIWQNSFNAYLYMGLVKGEFGNEFDAPRLKMEIPKFNIGFSNTIGFYPNTRTSFEYNLKAHFDSFLNRIDLEQNISGLDGERFILSSSFDINYFISPRFSISVSSYVNFVNFYTSVNQFVLDQSILNLASFPFCENNDCDNYINQKRLQQFYFGVSFEYNLF